MNNILERLLEFATDTYEVIKTLEKDPLLYDPKRQLVKSSSSPGANYSEAQSASSRKDFHNKIRIALKEMRESLYWLKYFQKICENKDKISSLMAESEELCKILSSIAFKTKPDNYVNSGI